MPGKAVDRWAAIVAPTPAYSSTDDVLWIADTGERYWVLLEESGWMLASWEFDPPEIAVWIELDHRVQLTG
jgi:hypothetical protein